MISYNECILYYINIFSKLDINISIYEIENIFIKILNIKDYFYIYKYNIIPFKYLKKITILIIKLINEYPIEYITNEVIYYSINMYIEYNLFIPRNETEFITYFICNYYNKISNNNNYILDIGTGIGNIPISLSMNIKNKNLFIHGIDININAINIARYNSKKFNIKNIKFTLENLFNFYKYNNRYNIIISNPPYISTENLNICNKGIFYESYISLFSNKKGLYHIIFIIDNYYKLLNRGGLLIIEHAFNHSKIIKKLLIKKNFKYIKTYKDNNLLNRFSIAFK